MMNNSGNSTRAKLYGPVAAEYTFGAKLASQSEGHSTRYIPFRCEINVANHVQFSPGILKMRQQCPNMNQHWHTSRPRTHIAVLLFKDG